MFRNNRLSSALKLSGVLAIALSPKLLLADAFAQYNLVSDVPGVATYTDPNLKNPWGVSFTNTSPFWVSNQGSGTSTLYNGSGVAQALVVTVPGSSTPPSGPTGQVSNGNAAEFGGAKFIFDTLNGTIAGWSSGGSAVTSVTTSGAVYTGLALANNGSADFLYAADSTGQIRVFNSSFAATTLSGNFTDPNAQAGFVPFNIQEINGNLYVTYAKLTAQGTGLPGGYIDEFSNNGAFIQRLATGGALYAPWAVTVAPTGFGSLGGDFLVGNFGNGEILEYSSTGAYLGTLNDANGNPIVNPYLWALDFRSPTSGYNPDALYFTAGYNSQQDGLFGDIVVAPEPAPFYTLGASLLAAVFLRRRIRRS
jgi:uncharacterized protein (TIGR03118 family)